MRVILQFAEIRKVEEPKEACMTLEATHPHDSVASVWWREQQVEVLCMQDFLDTEDIFVLCFPCEIGVQLEVTRRISEDQQDAGDLSSKLLSAYRRY